MSVAWATLGFSVAALLLVSVGYPLFLTVVGLGRREPSPKQDGESPEVTVIVAFSGTGPLLDRKIESLLGLSYPRGRLEILLACDGPLEWPERSPLDRKLAEMRWRLITLERAAGKAHALNAAARVATGTVLVFSDLDAYPEPDAIERLVRWFADETVGGVCGQRVIRRGRAIATEGQSAYVSWDSRIKRWENGLGAITSNDGKLYALRASFFEPIAPTATDDLYSSITVVLAGGRFLFDPSAKAAIPPPAGTVRHDFRRRRRVVIRSLSGLFARPRAFCLARFGLYGPRMLVNKLLRRMLPVFLLGVLLSTARLAPGSSIMAGLLAMQLLGYGLAAAYPAASGWLGSGRVSKAWQSLFYATLGMAGLLVGVLEFLVGKRISQWQPRKVE